MSDRIVIFGAGKIARGFIGHLLSISSLPFVFVEKNAALVESLQRAGRYTVIVMGHPEKNAAIETVAAIALDDEEEVAAALAETPLVFTSIGGQHLAEIAPVMARGLEARFATGRRGSLNVVTCENWLDPASALEAAVRERLPTRWAADFQRVGFTEAVVLRSAVDPSAEELARDPLAVRVQDYWELPVDGGRLKGDIPQVSGVRILPEFRHFLTRKLYTYNAANGTVSYLGWLRGHRTINAAVADPRILPILMGVYGETSRALSRMYSVPYEEQYAFAMTSLAKLRDPLIVDSLERNARDPIRKLGPDDRLLGPARLALEQGVAPEALATGIAAAIHYDNSADPAARKLASMLEREGLDGVLRSVCGLDPAGELGQLVRRKEEELRREGWLRGVAGSKGAS